jgi:hypothetical protein
LQPVRGGHLHEIHGMVEVQRYQDVAAEDILHRIELLVSKISLPSNYHIQLLEGREILETNGSMRWRMSSAVLIWFQQNHAQKSRMGVAMCFMLTIYIDWEQYNTLLVRCRFHRNWKIG